MPGRVGEEHTPPRGAAEDPHDDLVEGDPPGVRRLYTTALMADVLGVPPAAVRHWQRGGLLRPVRTAGSLEWFDFSQLVVGRHLARLLTTGLSLREIDTRLAAFAAGDLAAAATIADRIVADGRRLSLRAGDRLLGPGGQLQLAFTAGGHDAEWPDTATCCPIGDLEDLASTAPTCSWPLGAAAIPGDTAPEEGVVREMLDLADDLEAAGEFVEAAEALRAVLQAAGPAAPVMFMLAELLYRSGDLTAARERYYGVIELDAEHLRARTSLGCVLAELGDHELALAALEGVLRQEPDYADAHWHVAGVLVDAGRPGEARHHLGRFIELAPESPWANLARQRLGEA
jgi:tetratricopeptide (TPR) repeat protein